MSHLIFTPGNGGAEERSRHLLLGAHQQPRGRGRARHWQCLPLHFGIATPDMRHTFALLDNLRLNETRRVDFPTARMAVLSLRELDAVPKLFGIHS